MICHLRLHSTEYFKCASRLSWISSTKRALATCQWPRHGWWQGWRWWIGDDFFLPMIRDDGSGTLAKRSESCLDACVLYRGRTVTSFFLFHQHMAARGNYSEIFENFPPKSSFWGGVVPEFPHFPVFFRLGASLSDVSNSTLNAFVCTTRIFNSEYYAVS